MNLQTEHCKIIRAAVNCYAGNFSFPSIKQRQETRLFRKDIKRGKSSYLHPAPQPQSGSYRRAWFLFCNTCRWSPNKQAAKGSHQVLQQVQLCTSTLEKKIRENDTISTSKIRNLTWFHSLWMRTDVGNGLAQPLPFCMKMWPFDSFLALFA